MRKAASSPTRSIRLRLTLWNAGVVALILVALGVALRYSLQVMLTQSVDRGMTGIGGFIQGRVDASGDYHDAFPPRFRERFQRPADTRSTSTDPLDGKLWPRFVDLTGRPLLRRLPDSPMGMAGFRLAARGVSNFATVTLDHIPVRIYSRSIRMAGTPFAVLQIFHEMTDVDGEIGALSRVLLIFIPVGILLAGIGGAFLTFRAMQPVRAMTLAAAKIEVENLSKRLDESGRDEFATLAATFNGMLDRLEYAFRRLEQMYEQQRRFTGDASHELRTPLTIIKANASLAVSGSRTREEYVHALRMIDHAADRTNRILQDLLMLARADADQLDVRLEPLSVASVLHDACSLYRITDSARVHLEAVDPALTVRGNSGMLMRLVENLLGNAIRHTPASGSVTVTAIAEGSVVRLVVADTGEGISPDHLPHLTERFYRADPARSRSQGGTGLGLAICQSIVDAHHGTLRIESDLGKGTRVIVDLPAAPAAPNSADAVDAGGDRPAEEKRTPAVRR